MTESTCRVRKGAVAFAVLWALALAVAVGGGTADAAINVVSVGHKEATDNTDDWQDLFNTDNTGSRNTIPAGTELLVIAVCDMRDQHCNAVSIRQNGSATWIGLTRMGATAGTGNERTSLFYLNNPAAIPQGQIQFRARFAGNVRERNIGMAALTGVAANTATRIGPYHVYSSGGNEYGNPIALTLTAAQLPKNWAFVTARTANADQSPPDGTRTNLTLFSGIYMGFPQGGTIISGRRRSSARMDLTRATDSADPRIMNYAAGANMAGLGVAIRPRYTINATSGGNGSASGGGQYDHGLTATVIATPNAGYRFLNWTVGGAPVSTNATYAFTATDDRSLVANFIQTWTLTYTPGAGGTISGISPQTVDNGGSGTPVTAVPSAGYRFGSWSDGVLTAARTDTNVTGNITVTANFIKTWTLTYTPGAGGSISGTTPQTVDNGGSGTPVTAVASAGYRFGSWSDGVMTAARTDTNVTANVAVTANFIKTWTLTYTPGAGGTVSGTSPQTVDNGANGAPVTAVPNTGYHFVDWSDGVLTAARTDTNVTANITATANFAINTYTITASAGVGGSITPSGAVPVNHGSDQAFTIAANAGYRILEVLVNGVAQGPVSDYTFTNVTGNGNTIAASFQKTWTVSVSVNPAGAGSVTGGGVYDDGATAVLDPTANAGYGFDSWSGDASGSDDPLSLLVDGDKSVTANFISLDKTITASAGVGGTITPSGVVVVTYGDDQTFGIAADPGYRILDVLVDGSSVGAVANYTFTNVTVDHTIAASFQKVWTVSVSADPAAGGSITGGGVYNAGATAILDPTANAGFGFTGWSGDASGTDDPLSLLVDGDKSVTANFADIENPVAVCQDIAVNLASPTILAAAIDGGSTDNSGGIALMTIDGAADKTFTCADLAASPVTVTLVVFDTAGNSDTCTASVTVTDADPDAGATALLSVTPDTGVSDSDFITNADDIVLQGTVGSALPGTKLNVEVSTASGGPYGPLASGLPTLGGDFAVPVNGVAAATYYLVFQTETACGTQGAWSSEYTVIVDRTAPTAACPAPVEVAADTACLGVIPDLTGDVTATDNVAGTLAVTQDPVAGTPVGLGDTTVTMTVTDVAGNTNTCAATVTVVDAPPAAPALVQMLPDTGVAGDFITSASDFQFQGTVGSAEPGTLLNIRVHGLSGLLPDTFMAQWENIPTAGGLFAVPLTDIDPATYYLVFQTVNNCGTPSAWSSERIVIVDQTPPTITACAADREVAADGTCQGAIPDLTGDVVAADNVPGTLGVTQSPPAGTVVAMGDHTVTLTVTDLAGNTNTCDTIVTVADLTGPTFSVCAPDRALTPGPGCTGTVPDMLSEVTAIDDPCGGTVVGIVQDPIAGTSFTGAVTVVFTATDNSGNTGTCETLVSLVDTEAPVAACQDFTVDAADGIVTGADIDGGSTDNCVVFDRLIDGAASVTYTCADLGDHTVTLTVLDANGNSDTCSATVTVVDGTAPEITLTGDAAVVLDNGETYTELSATALDGCDGDLTGALVIGGDTVNDRAPGVYTVTYTVSDAAGNEAVATRTVTVQRVACALVVNAVATDIDASPGDTVVLEVTLGAANCAIGDIHYDWKKDDGSKALVSLPSAADDPVLTLTDVTPADSGVYVCEVSDDMYAVQSPEINVTVASGVPAAGGLGLALAAVAAALTGVGALRRRK